jgi:transposase
MPYRIAGIDVHKKKLAVVVADVEVEEAYQFERRWYGSNPEQLRLLAQWLIEQQVEEVVMESTAQYWKPVWGALERYWKPTCQNREGAGRMSGSLHLAQALSNRGRRGRKKDFRDAERLVKRLVSQELTLSFVPDAEQRLWRTLTRTKYQRTRDKVRLQNQLEALLEEAHIKLSSLVSDLLGVSARRMLKALAEGATDPAALAALADQRLRATAAELRDALGACTELNPVYRRLVKLALADLHLIEEQIGQLDQEIASLLREHQEAVQRLAEVPGLGVDSVQQIIAEIGAKAASFPSAKNLVSWVGACPGDDESAGVNRSKRSPKGNRQMRRILYEAISTFQVVEAPS